MNLKTFVRNSYPYRVYGLVRDYSAWARREFAAPSPHFIKQACLIRNGFPQATWIETGTYFGQTTEVLARHGSVVYSIEPEPTLYANAKRYFLGFPNVEIYNGLSEDILPSLLPRISGDVNFWLDGHYSGGVTFKGPQATPILDELSCISENLARFGKTCVLIDDIRCFTPHSRKQASYPSVDLLVDWARQNKLRWHIEHDIFVAKTEPCPREHDGLDGTGPS